VETSKNRKKMTKAIEQAENSRRLEEDPLSKYKSRELYYLSRRGESDLSPDACLIRAYMKKSRGLHVRRTLDQSHYSMLPATEERDVDQILLKRGKDKNPEMKMVMVDQLWMWMFDSTSLHLFLVAGI